MRRYDLHVHTDASPCSAASPAAVVRGALEAGLDGIAITDHDTTENVAAVRDAAPDHLDVISGVEVTTTGGHLLALGVDQVPTDRDPRAAVEAVQRAGGFAVPAHPFDAARQPYERLSELAALVDAVETVNSRCVLPRFNRRAAAFVSEHSLPGTGGSDAHFPMEIGRAYTVCGGSLRAALERGDPGQFDVRGRGMYVSGHVATKLHQFRSRLSV